MGPMMPCRGVLQFLPSPDPARFYPLSLLTARYLWRFHQKADINEVQIALSFRQSAMREDEEDEKFFKKGLMRWN